MVRTLHLAFALAASCVAGDVPSCLQSAETTLLQGSIMHHKSQPLQPSIPDRVTDDVAAKIHDTTHEKVAHEAFLQDQVVKAAPGQQSPYAYSTPPMPDIGTPTRETSAWGQLTNETLEELNSQGNPMLKVMLPDLYADIGGKCLDGDMSGYYYRPGASGNNLWIFFMEGGGGCTTQAKCENWILSKRPSDWANTKHGDGLLDSSNPDFGGAHQVFIPYCTGDNHLGQVVTPVNGCADNDADCVDQWGNYFSGHLNFKNILHHIFSNEPASRRMTDLLLSGSSAGATGVIHQCDWLQEVLPSHVQVKCAPVASFSSPGYAEDHMDNDGDVMRAPSLYADYPTTVTSLEDEKASYEVKLNLHRRYTSPSCREEYTGGDGWRCASPTVVYGFTGPPVHITHNKYDRTFIGGFGFPAPAQCTSDGEKYLDYFGRAVQTTLDTMLREQDGLWLASCYMHTENIKHKGASLGPYRTFIRGIDSLQAVTDWYFNRTSSNKIIDDCNDEMSELELPCNPDCATFSAAIGADGRLTSCTSTQ